MKERILSARDRKDERKKCQVGRRHVEQYRTHFRFKLGEELDAEHNICVHSFRNLLSIGKRAWKRLSSSALSCAPGPIKHGNTGMRNRHVGSILYETEPDVVDFLKQIGVEHGESYATRFIRERTSVGLRREEEDAIDLPSCFTKRKLYER